MNALLNNSVANPSARPKRSRSPPSQEPVPSALPEPDVSRRGDSKRLAQAAIKSCVDDLLDIQRQINSSRAPGGSKEAFRRPFYDVLQKMEPLLYMMSHPQEYTSVEAAQRYRTGEYNTDLRNVHATLQVYMRTINLLSFDPFLLTYATFVLLSLVPTLTEIDALAAGKPDVLHDVLLHALNHLRQQFPSVLEHTAQQLLTDRVIQAVLPVCHASSYHTEYCEVVLSLEANSVEGLSPVTGVETKSSTLLFTRTIRTHNQFESVLLAYGLCHIFSRPSVGSPYLLSVKQYALLAELQCGLVAVRWEHRDGDRGTYQMTGRELARARRYGKVLTDAAGTMLLNLIAAQCLVPEVYGSVAVRAVLLWLKEESCAAPCIADWPMQVLQYFVRVPRYTSLLAVLCASSGGAYGNDVEDFLTDLAEAAFAVVDRLLCAPLHPSGPEQDRVCPNTETFASQLLSAEYLVSLLEDAFNEAKSSSGGGGPRGASVASEVMRRFMSVPTSLPLVRRFLSHRIPYFYYARQPCRRSPPLRLLSLIPLGVFDSPGFASLLQGAKESGSLLPFAFAEMCACVGRELSAARDCGGARAAADAHKRHCSNTIALLRNALEHVDQARAPQDLGLLADVFLLALETTASTENKGDNNDDDVALFVLRALDSEWSRFGGAVNATFVLSAEAYALLFHRICSRASARECAPFLASIRKQVQASPAVATADAFAMLKRMLTGILSGFALQFASKQEVPAADAACVANLMESVVNDAVLKALEEPEADAATMQVLSAATNFVLTVFCCCTFAEKKGAAQQDQVEKSAAPGAVNEKPACDVVVDVDDSDVEEVTTSTAARTTSAAPAAAVAASARMGDCLPSRGGLLGIIAQLGSMVLEGALSSEVEAEAMKLFSAFLIISPTTPLLFGLETFIVKVAASESIEVRQDVGCFAVYRLICARFAGSSTEEDGGREKGAGAAAVALVRALGLLPEQLKEADIKGREQQIDTVLKFGSALLCRNFDHFMNCLPRICPDDVQAVCPTEDAAEATWASWCREEGTQLFATCVQISRVTHVSSLLQCDALETACDLLHVLGWSVENVCQRYPQIVTAPLFRSLCQSEDVDAEIVVRNSLAPLLGPYVIDKVRPEEGQQITNFMKNNLSAELVSTETILPPLVAYVLYTYGGSAAEKKAELLLQLFQTVQLADEDIRPHFSKHLAAIVLNILSLEANAQQRRVEEMPPDSISSDKLHSSVSYLVFSEAVRQAVSVAQSEPTRSALTHALSAPMTTDATAQVLVRTVFDVVDSVSGFIIDKKRVDIHGYNRVAPFCTLQRWLLALSSLVCFMGTQHSLIAAKVGAMLDSCPLDGCTAPYVALVWYHFISQCSDAFLQEHAFSLVIDVINVELSTPQEAISATAVAQLSEILGKVLGRLVQVAASDPFWTSHSTVLGTRSALIAKMQGEKRFSALSLQNGGSGSGSGGARRMLMRSPKRRGKGAASESEMARLETRRESASQIILGFISVMQSSTKKCKRVFVRCFHSYLQSLSPAERVCMTVAAEAFPLLISALLDCSREFSKDNTEDVELALQSIGLLGAVSPHNLPDPSDAGAASAAAAAAPSSSDQALSKNQRNRHLDPQKVIFWECFAFYLLSDYCPRALSNTANNDMHDRLAFAIQEILRLCTKQQRKSRSGTLLRDDEFLHTQELEGYWWWADLSASVKKMLEGFLSTRYHTCIYQTVEPRSPLYLPGMSVHAWSFALFNFLLVRSGGAYGEMFATLRNVAKRDYTLMEFLLPYVLVHLLEFGTEDDTAEVVQEFHIVFDAAAPGTHGRHHSVAGGGGGKEAFEPLSMRLESSVENPRRNASFVDAHVQLLVNILEDISQLRWQLLMAAEENKHDPKRENDIKRWVSCARSCGEFLTRVDQHRRVVASMEIGNNMRALRSLECQRYLPSAAEALKVAPLQRIFAALGDRDSSRCIHHISHPSLEEEAFSCENNGDWYLALQNCDLVLQQKKNSVPHMLTALRCLRQLGQLHLMSRYAQAQLAVSDTEEKSTAALIDDEEQHMEKVKEGENEGSTTATTSATPSVDLDVVGSTSSSRSVLQWYTNEASWRLGEWDHIQDDPTLPVSLAVPVKRWTHFVQRRHESGGGGGDEGGVHDVHEAVRRQCTSLGDTILSTTREGYEQGYASIALLHAFTDLDIACEIVGKKHQHRLGRGAGADADAGAEMSLLAGQVVRVLTERMEVTEPTLEAREPLLSLHRVLYKTLNLPEKVADAWLVYAQLLKDAGLYEAAWRAARQAVIDSEDVALSPDYYRVSAQLLYDMGNSRQAVEFAQERVDDDKLSAEVRSELKVMMTNWSLETGSQSTDDVIAAYKAALTLHEWDGAYYHLALFYDKVYTTCAESLTTRGSGAPAATAAAAAVAAESTNTDQELVQLISTYAVCAVEKYGLALIKGVSSASVSLPRLLTLWLDSAARLQEIGKQHNETGSRANSVCLQLNRIVEKLLLNSQKGIPPYVLMSALPQLLSRLCHPCAPVKSIITRCVSLLASKYTQVCLWSLLPIALSAQQERAENVRQHILNSFAKAPAQNSDLQCAFEVINALITLCQAAFETVKKDFKLTQQPFIAKIKDRMATYPFILPTLANLTPSIDNGVHGRDVFDVTSTFLSFDDRVVVMNSLQKPKRMWVHTREGQTVCFLCKAKDEPRKDIRVMELAALINSFFLTDAEAGRRMFNLRRYAVAALNDDCALIEWMDHTQVFRSAVDRCYALDGTGLPLSQIKLLRNEVEMKKKTKLQMYTQGILPSFPRVFHQWFDRMFVSNQAWYDARTLYTQSNALWSMVGHIVGLGDRHGENLMLDLKRGEVCHVDFACMFDKGETLNEPERVRFRLTPNLVDAMGILGTDGPFRANCEIALRCQVKNKNAIMSVVETLLHDPLVEWMKTSSRGGQTDARPLIQRVKRRLDGYLDLYTVPRERDKLVLNVEGQVSKLINHASSVENLSEMYTWWMAWL